MTAGNVAATRDIQEIGAARATHLGPATRVSLPAQILLLPIRFYQRFITPYTPATCRYYPTCSAYAATALREHGAVKGLWLGVRRLGRCHPWSEGGIDYVPPRKLSRRERPAAADSSPVQPGKMSSRQDLPSSPLSNRSSVA